MTRALPATLLLSLGVFTGCESGGAGEDRAPAVVVAVSGAGQSAVAGEALAQPLVAVVRDAAGRPAPGVRVTWAVTGGNGSVSPSVTETGTDGQTSVGATAGTVASANAFTASVDGVARAAVFSVVGLPGPAVRLERASGDGQSGVRGSSLGSPLVAKVADRFDNGVPGVEVEWAVVGGSGEVNPARASSASDGTASAAATLAITTAENAFTASVAGLAGSPVRFEATGHAGPAARIVVYAGAGQVGTAGAPLPAPLQVRVTDVNDVPVTGAEVRWRAVSGAGTVGGAETASSTTGDDGRAEITAVLDPIAGPNEFSASAPAIPDQAVAFPETGVAGPPSAFLRLSPVDGEFRANTVVPLVVAVTDAHGNPVEGALVAFGVGPFVTQVHTDAAGRATFEAVVTLGDTIIRAFGPADGQLILFHLAGVLGPPASISRVEPATDGQSPSGTPVPLAVAVADDAGNPLEGVELAWAATAGDGSVAPGASTTGADGVGRATATLGERNGPNVFQASVAGLSPATFSIVGVSGPVGRLARIGPAGDQQPIGLVRFAVWVTDAYGNPVEGAQVVWTAGVGLALVVATGPDGLSVIVLQVNAGPNVFTASVTAPGVPEIVFPIFGVP